MEAIIVVIILIFFVVFMATMMADLLNDTFGINILKPFYGLYRKLFVRKYTELVKDYYSSPAMRRERLETFLDDAYHVAPWTMMRQVKRSISWGDKNQKVRRQVDKILGDD